MARQPTTSDDAPTRRIALQVVDPQDVPNAKDVGWRVVGVLAGEGGEPVTEGDKAMEVFRRRTAHLSPLQLAQQFLQVVAELK